MAHPTARPEKRRAFLRALASTSTLALGACAAARGHEEGEAEGEEAEVTPGEDLMQEHGVLERILLVYGEGARRLEGGEELEPAVLAAAAGIVRDFVEDYHERNEEEFLFPRLEAAHREVELVAVLRRQHERGRELTATISALARIMHGPTAELARALRAFERMYRPHAAREDTVLFPAFRELVGRDAYHELGEELEEREHALFGHDGFEDAVAHVARLEQALGIHELERFTP